MSSVHTKLMSIQTQIKAPKNMYNSFGKYNYRNAESIFEAVKPYLAQSNCILTVTDEIVPVGNRIYVKAIAIFTDCETGESVQVSAMAREPEIKKGMDDSQITGSTSSYARKYALNGLFLLDDTKDADSEEYHEVSNNQQQRQQPQQYQQQNANAEFFVTFESLLESYADYFQGIIRNGKTFYQSAMENLKARHLENCQKQYTFALEQIKKIGG